MKKMFALLLAAMMLLAMMPAAMAYTAVRPGTAENNYVTTGVNQYLKLTEEDSAGLAYTITYKYTVGDTVAATPASGIVNIANAVTGAPTIADISFSPADTNTGAYNSGNRTYTKTLSIDWSGVAITEPGVYAWPVNKTVSDNDGDTTQEATNIRGGDIPFYLYVVVTASGNNLSVGNTFISTNPPTKLVYPTTENPNLTNPGKGDFEDQYPATTLDLIIAKTVTGNQGSKDKYFKFEIVLSSPDTVNTTTHALVAGSENSGYDYHINKSAYNDEFDNLTEIQIKQGSSGKVYLWLKDGQSVKIPNLPYGTAYTILEVEAEREGYTIEKIEVSDTTAGATINTSKGEVSDGSLDKTATVTYTNDKTATVPTGIELETTAPIVGMILAMAMLALMFVGKRKEEMA